MDLSAIARQTPGMSGADLANLLNEGALPGIQPTSTPGGGVGVLGKKSLEGTIHDIYIYLVSGKFEWMIFFCCSGMSIFTKKM